MSRHTLLNQLKKRIAGEVRTDSLYRILLASDGSIFQKKPAGVVYPKTTADVVETVRFAGDHGMSVHARGAGSGLCGASLGAGIVVDFSKYMNRLIRIDTDTQTFACEPGYRFGELAAALQTSPLFFPPDPSSGEYASFGGMYATNASGAHSVKYGNVADYIEDAQMVLGDGSRCTLSRIQSTPPENLPENLRALFRLYTQNKERIEAAYPSIPCNVSGYNLRGLVRDNRLALRRLFAGAEGTLGIATRLTFRLHPRPRHDALVVAYFNDILHAAEAVQRIMPMGPSGIEIMDKSLLNIARNTDARLKKRIPGGVDNVLLIEFDGAEKDECLARVAQSLSLLKKAGLTDRAYAAISSEEKARFWAIRKAAVPILYKLKGEKKILALIEDAAVPTDRLTDYFKGLYALFRRNGVDFVLYGHIAKGLIHTRPLLNLKREHDVKQLKILAEAAFELVHGLGGAVSGEHGDGRLRSAFLKKMYPDIHGLFRQTKRLLDPDNRLNPDIITMHDPNQMQQDLRYGAAYRATDFGRTQLVWPEGFVTEVEKCHGCTKCTTVTTATRMCPVYKFTRDEAAAPKAKANLLRALISGAVSNRLLYEKAFQTIMDNCANCGSCHVECPSGVNIPKMAMEARARYVARYGGSLHARIVSHPEQAARATRKISRWITPVMNRPWIKQAAAPITGISARRPAIEFSSRSLFERVPPKTGNGNIHVLYFAGCFAGYMAPHIGEALVRVLTHMGMTVYTPPQHCCGLPAMTKGLTRTARTDVRRNLNSWENLSTRVNHIVVTCSSCGYALMQDWAALLKDRRIRQIARKTIHISSLINRYFHRLKPAHRPERAAYHQPCHLKLQPDADATIQLLQRLSGMDVQKLDSHCCGMIGSWGLARKNEDLSAAIGSDLIGKLNASGAPVAITDCPTCRMQMETLGEKPVRHPIEVIAGRLA